MLRLTPDIVAGAYDFLRECPPFKVWKLPPGEEIGFRIVRDSGCHGYYQFDGKQHNIGISDIAVGHTNSLLKVVGHEMIHLYQYLAHRDTSGAVHNKDFRRLAVRVCRLHGWDEKMFFV